MSRPTSSVVDSTRLNLREAVAKPTSAEGWTPSGALVDGGRRLIPMLLGDGIRLFEDLDTEGIQLRRTNSIETPGATHLRFEVVNRKS